MNIRKLYFHVDYMSICVAYKDETKAPEGISAAAPVTRLSSAPSWQMVALRANEWHRQLAFKPGAGAVHVWPEGKQKGGRRGFYICARKERVKSWVNTEQKRKICSELSYYCNIGSGYRVLGFINVTKSRSWKARTFFFSQDPNFSHV